MSNPSVLELEADHRRHAVVENAIRDLKDGMALDHLPSGRFGANGALARLQRDRPQPDALAQPDRLGRNPGDHVDGAHAARRCAGMADTACAPVAPASARTLAGGAAVSGWVGAPALTLRGRPHARVTAHRDPIPPRLPRTRRTRHERATRTAQTSQSTDRRSTLAIVAA
jgi:hypothetical protein